MIPVRRNRTTDIVTYKLTAYQVDTSIIFDALVPDKFTYVCNLKKYWKNSFVHILYSQLFLCYLFLQNLLALKITCAGTVRSVQHWCQQNLLRVFLLQHQEQDEPGQAAHPGDASPLWEREVAACEAGGAAEAAGPHWGCGEPAGLSRPGHAHQAHGCCRQQQEEPHARQPDKQEVRAVLQLFV